TPVQGPSSHMVRLSLRSSRPHGDRAPSRGTQPSGGPPASAAPMDSSSQSPPAGGDPSEDGAAAELPRLTVTQVEQMKVEARVADIYRVLFDAAPNAKSVMLELWRDQHVEYLTKGLRHLAPSFHVLDAKYCFSSVKLNHMPSLVYILLTIFFWLFQSTLVMLLDGSWACGAG
uniref:Uncharacterized protein n=2 Tax=Aegilops tauschii subsp. strangulata TaxID=200361 RepID=A0A453FGF5_AEGTS